MTLAPRECARHTHRTNPRRCIRPGGATTHRAAEFAASVANGWRASLRRGPRALPRGCLTLRLTPEERNARAGSDGAPDALAPAHIPGMSGAKMAAQPENL